MYGGNQAEAVHADVHARRGRFLCRFRGVREGRGGTEALRFVFFMCSLQNADLHAGRVVCFFHVQQQCAEKDAHVDLHAVRGVVGRMLVAGSRHSFFSVSCAFAGVRWA